MSKFTDIELEYLKTQRLGRLATINKNGEPQLAPVTCLYIDPAHHQIVVVDQQQTHHLEYDYLVYALGSVTDRQNVPGVASLPGRTREIEP